MSRPSSMTSRPATVGRKVGRADLDRAVAPANEVAHHVVNRADSADSDDGNVTAWATCHTTRSAQRLDGRTAEAPRLLCRERAGDANRRPALERADERDGGPRRQPLRPRQSERRLSRWASASCDDWQAAAPRTLRPTNSAGHSRVDAKIDPPADVRQEILSSRPASPGQAVQAGRHRDEFIEVATGNVGDHRSSQPAEIVKVLGDEGLVRPSRSS